MLDTSIMSARDLQKSYKSIIQGVKTKNHAVVLTTNNIPQAALVSLEDLEELKIAKTRQAALEMLRMASDNAEELKSLPGDLRSKANEILYNKQL